LFNNVSVHPFGAIFKGQAVQEEQKNDFLDLKSFMSLDATYRGADRSLARPGRKEAAATKL